MYLLLDCFERRGADTLYLHAGDFISKTSGVDGRRKEHQEKIYIPHPNTSQPSANTP
jgi:hypothetical protein